MRSPTVTKKRKRYTDEFKVEVLRAVETRGQRTIAEVTASLGVADGLIHTWRSKVSSEALAWRSRRSRSGGASDDSSINKRLRAGR